MSDADEAVDAQLVRLRIEIDDDSYTVTVDPAKLVEKFKAEEDCPHPDLVMRTVLGAVTDVLNMFRVTGDERTVTPFESAVERAVDEPTLEEALAWMAGWEQDRVTLKKAPVMETAFAHAFSKVLECWKEKSDEV